MPRSTPYLRAAIAACIASTSLSHGPAAQAQVVQSESKEDDDTGDLLDTTPDATPDAGPDAPSPGELSELVDSETTQGADPLEVDDAARRGDDPAIKQEETEASVEEEPLDTSIQDEVAEQIEQESTQRVEISGAPGRGLTLKASDAYSLNIRSRIQIRYQLHVPPEDEAGEREIDQLVNIGTARLWFSGNVFKPELTYMIQLAVAGRDYRDGATSPIYDAFIDYKAHRDLSLRAGQYFVPFDRLRTVREWALQMADRPRPVLEFTLDRDVGVTAYSERFLGDHSPLAWYLGVFGGGGTNLTQGREPGSLVVARAELRPLGPIDDDREGDLERRRKPALALGVASAANFNTNRLRSTTGPTFRGGTTDYLHAASDVVFKWWGFAFQAEYLWKQASADSIVSTAADGTTLTEYTRSGHGWVLQASYVLDPPVEFVGRLTRTYAYAGTDPAFIAETAAYGQEVGGGMNYYLNGHWFKLQADWIARMPYDFDFNRADHLVHAQLDVTF